ncbi:MAG: hypothetical protein ACJ77N_03245, partial [Chloroflexota bacterium]
RAATTLAASLDPAEVVFAPTAGRALQASLPIATTPESGRSDVVLVLGQGPAEQVWHSTLAPARKRVVLDAPSRRRPRLPPGRHRLAARLDGVDGPSLELGTAVVDGRRRIFPDGVERIGTLRAIVDDVARRTRLRDRARRAYRRLPPPVQRPLRSSWHAVRGRRARGAGA